MNYIGLDLSLTSTGLYILLSNGTEHYFNYRNNTKMTKWHKVLSYVNYQDYAIPEIDDYSTREVAKIIKYNEITDKIVKDILSLCKPEESIIITEGFSYGSSNTISLIDLVAYATLLRNKLLSYNFVDFIIKSPSTLKVDTCRITYKPIEKIIGGKKPRTEYIYKNTLGISGGSFKKPDMLESVFDNENIQIKIKDSLSYHKHDLLTMKNIPTPISDLIDAVLLVYTTKQ